MGVHTRGVILFLLAYSKYAVAAPGHKVMVNKGSVASGPKKIPTEKSETMRAKHQLFSVPIPVSPEVEQRVVVEKKPQLAKNKTSGLAKALKESRQLSEQLHIATNGVKELDVHLAAEISENHVLEQQIAAMRKDNQDAQQVSSQWKAQYEDMVPRFDNTARQLSSTQVALNKTYRVLTSKQVELDSTHQELNAKQMELDSTRQDLSMLHTKVDASTSQLATAKKTINATAELSSVLRSRLANVTAELTAKNDEEVEELGKAHRDVTQAVAIEKQFAQEERALLGQKHHAKALAREVHHLRKVVKSDNDRIKSDNEKMVAMREEAAKRNEVLEKRIGSLEKRDDDLAAAVQRDVDVEVSGAKSSDATSPNQGAIVGQQPAPNAERDSAVAETERAIAAINNPASTASAPDTISVPAVPEAAEVAVPEEKARSEEPRGGHRAYDALKNDQLELKRENLRIRARLRSEAGLPPQKFDY